MTDEEIIRQYLKQKRYEKIMKKEEELTKKTWREVIIIIFKILFGIKSW
jgi:hypothetical protein